MSAGTISATFPSQGGIIPFSHLAVGAGQSGNVSVSVSAIVLSVPHSQAKAVLFHLVTWPSEKKVNRTIRLCQQWYYQCHIPLSQGGIIPFSHLTVGAGQSG